jgi:elongation factor G
MSVHHVEDIRDIALVGHRGAGKTTLADALLFEAHAVDRQGNVDDGTSNADTDDDEKQHHFSIDTHVLHAEHEGKYLHILDSPGSPDFIGAALESLVAAETALVVVNGVNGVEVNTRRMFAEAGQRGLARAFVINKLDDEKANYTAVVDALQETFGKLCVPFNVPNATGAMFRSVVDVLGPSDAAALVAARTQLIEAVVESDESLMETYLTEGSVPLSAVETALPQALQLGTVIPIFACSAKADIGVKELLHALVAYGLSPAMARKKIDLTKDERHAAIEPSETGDFVGQVFKVVNDRYVGHLSFIRVIAGKLTPNHPIVNLTTHQTLRIGQLLLVQGNKHVTVTEAVPGDIIAVAKVDGLHIGDTVADKADAPAMPGLRFPSPMFGLAVEPKARGDEQRIATGLHKIAEEDPTVKIVHDPQTHELVISGVSPMHLEIIKERLRHRYDVDVTTKDPKVPYRETIATPAGADYRHKKQSGGRGQFAEVHLRVHPLDRGISSKEQCEAEFANKSRFEKLRSVHYDPLMNFAFLDHVVGGTIPNQFMPAIEKGIRELLERGALAGYPIRDVAVEVFFGKDHAVDSSEAAFKIAGRLAFKKAFLAARPSLLEPVVKLEITAPAKSIGTILGDLPTKRAHVENQENLPGDQVAITAKVPLAEVARYAAQLGGMTQGQGSYTMELSHYDPVPTNLQAQIVAKAVIKKDEDE